MILGYFLILIVIHSALEDVADDFPKEFVGTKVLPELLKSMEFGGGGPKVFASVMKIGAKLSDDDYDSTITPVIIRLFSNPDRGIRVCLLNNLHVMIDHLSQKIVNEKIFPQMVGILASFSLRMHFLTVIGCRLHGPSTIGSRANSQGRLDGYHKTK